MELEPHTPPQAAPALVEFPTPQGSPLSSALLRYWAHNNATGQNYVSDDTDNSVQSDQEKGSWAYATEGNFQNIPSTGTT